MPQRIQWCSKWWHWPAVRLFHCLKKSDCETVSSPRRPLSASHVISFHNSWLSFTLLMLGFNVRLYISTQMCMMFALWMLLKEAPFHVELLCKMTSLQARFGGNGTSVFCVCVHVCVVKEAKLCVPLWLCLPNPGDSGFCQPSLGEKSNSTLLRGKQGKI